MGAGRALCGPAPSSAQSSLVPHVAAGQVHEQEHERQDCDDGGTIRPGVVPVDVIDPEGVDAVAAGRRTAACFRLPYGVIPNGLYTPSTVAITSKIKARIA